jgi:hypothetical protein
MRITQSPKLSNKDNKITTSRTTITSIDSLRVIRVTSINNHVITENQCIKELTILEIKTTPLIIRVTMKIILKRLIVRRSATLKSLAT